MPGRTFWDITKLVERDPLQPPTPKDLIHCKVCRGMLIFFKDYTVFEHPHHKGEFRIDLQLKCGRCGHVMQFSIHIVEWEYEKLLSKLYQKESGKRRVSWTDLPEHVNVNHLYVKMVGEKIKERARRKKK